MRIIIRHTILLACLIFVIAIKFQSPVGKINSFSYSLLQSRGANPINRGDVPASIRRDVAAAILPTIRGLKSVRMPTKIGRRDILTVVPALREIDDLLARIEEVLLNSHLGTASDKALLKLNAARILEDVEALGTASDASPSIAAKRDATPSVCVTKKVESNPFSVWFLNSSTDSYLFENKRGFLLSEPSRIDISIEEGDGAEGLGHYEVCYYESDGSFHVKNV